MPPPRKKGRFSRLQSAVAFVVAVALVVFLFYLQAAR
jgi:hypothetical protein